MFASANREIKQGTKILDSLKGRRQYTRCEPRVFFSCESP